MDGSGRRKPPCFFVCEIKDYTSKCPYMLVSSPSWLMQPCIVPDLLFRLHQVFRVNAGATSSGDVYDPSADDLLTNPPLASWGFFTVQSMHRDQCVPPFARKEQSQIIDTHQSRGRSTTLVPSLMKALVHVTRSYHTSASRLPISTLLSTSAMSKRR